MWLNDEGYRSNEEDEIERAEQCITRQLLVLVTRTAELRLQGRLAWVSRRHLVLCRAGRSYGRL